MSVGQLENNLRWEVVLNRQEQKEKLLACNLTVKGFAAMETIQKLQTFVFFLIDLQPNTTIKFSCMLYHRNLKQG